MVRAAVDAKALTLELLEAVRAGDQAARDRVIEVNLPLCRYHVKLAGASVNATRRAEAESECRLALTQAVARIATGIEVDDPNRYLAEVVRATASRAICNDDLVSIPRETVRRHKDSIDPRPPLRRLGSAELPDFGSRDNVTSDHETWEELEACCEQQIEREVIWLLSMGQTAEEIAKKLYIAAPTVYFHRNTVRARYVERNPECGLEDQ